MAQTKSEYILELIAERLLTIKEGELCHITNDEYDLTIDSVFTTVEEYEEDRNQRAKKSCKIYLNYAEGMIGANFGRYRKEKYVVEMQLNYERQMSDPKSDYDKYSKHLPTWIALVLSDETSITNNLWTEVYSKPLDSKLHFKVLKRNPGQSWQAKFTMAIEIRDDLKNIFVN